MIEKDFELERELMVENQIVGRGIKNNKVIEAMRIIPRHRFIPKEFKKYSYKDLPVLIGYGQTISQPYVVALMLELIYENEYKKILEIGTGSGYQTALLSEMGFEKIFTVEINYNLLERSKKLLRELGYNNIEYKFGDGHLGWKENSPYDAIIVSAASKEIPDELTGQLADCGKLVIPIGESDQILLKLFKTKERIHKEKISSVKFVPLVRKNP